MEENKKTKGIILIDKVPECCMTCRYMVNEDECNIYCSATGYGYDYKVNEYIDGREKPKWCPIKILPGKKEMQEDYTYVDRAMVAGWNEYRKEILKGENIEENKPHQEQR